MTQESKLMIKKYWQSGVIVIITIFITQFLANFASQKLWEYRIEQLETKLNNHIEMFENEYKPNIDILSWMHSIGTRSEAKNEHEHKN